MVTWEDLSGNGMVAAEIAPNGTIGPAETIMNDPQWYSSEAVVAFDGPGNGPRSR